MAAQAAAALTPGHDDAMPGVGGDTLRDVHRSGGSGAIAPHDHAPIGFRGFREPSRTTAPLSSPPKRLRIQGASYLVIVRHEVDIR